LTGQLHDSCLQIHKLITHNLEPPATMTSAVAKFAARKMLKGEMQKYAKKDVAGEYDPYFATITDPRSGKKRKVKKEVPDYIPDHQAMILAKVRKRAYRLDCSLFNFLGFRFGWSSVVGIVPAIGDFADGAMALQTIRVCKKANNKDFTLSRNAQLIMLLWLVIDVLVGLVPFVGDLADASFKANSRICRELEKELDKAFKPKSVKAPRPATVYEEFNEEDLAGLRDSYEGEAGMQRPAEARRPTERRGEVIREKKGWFSGGKKQRQPDEEAQIQRHTRSGTRDGPVRSGTRDGPQQSSSQREDRARSGTRDGPTHSGTRGSRR